MSLRKHRPRGESFIPIVLIFASAVTLFAASVVAQGNGPSNATPVTTTTTRPAPVVTGAPLVKTVSPQVPKAAHDLDVLLLTIASNDYRSFPDWNLWHAVGICEQKPSSPAYDSNGDGIAWHGSPLGGLPGSDYGGGLGLSRDFWREFAPRAGVTVTDGALASPADQIRVARAGSQNGTHMRGWDSWKNGCVQREMSGG